ncbi:CHC2 zinc finger domain-containing protein [Cognatishimia sp. D5M38]|uniref:CHC2 zinc finger domain-containing protein n=1 Tax=Cognatishimia coralii TaxID=3083254 RepID=A0ABU8QLE5_9RHOB|nr:CHC2 zinc finger domain-containing protein [Donghicola eburneus]MCI5040723.1 CHC2 zinc finger domain-containing protein [Donghicola eburneus]
MARSKYPKFSEVQARADFPAILKHYGIKAKPAGDELVCSCPFHEDKTPSCFIHPEKRLFKCFGCGIGGNIFEFVRLKENLGDSGHELGIISKIIMDVCDIPLSDVTGNRASLRKPRGTSKVHTETTKKEKKVSEVNKPLSFQLHLAHNIPFLKSRGICEEAERVFGLGVAKRGTLRGRIAIPIHNRNGELVAYCGRFASEYPPEGEPRYKLPKNFNKGLELFNLHRAMALKLDYVVIVEGFWSAIRLHMLGVPCVALMGSHARQTQLDLIVTSGFKRAYVVLDGDEAGRLGAEKATIDLAGYMMVRRIDLPDGIKPDTMDQKWIDQLV